MPISRKTRRTRTPRSLPIELVCAVLAHAARMSIEDDPISAAALQLVSPSARALLLPILYEVFTVRWARNAPSLVLMLRMVTELPTPAVRAHIRHLVFILPTRHALTTLPKTKFASSEGWHIDSVALCWDSAFKPNLLRMVAWHFRLRPRRLFIDSHGDFLGVTVGAGVQQRLPEGRFPEYEGFIAHIEEVHTACSFFAHEESRCVPASQSQSFCQFPRALCPKTPQHLVTLR